MSVGEYGPCDKSVIAHSTAEHKMANILKRIRKSSLSLSKHEKLLEDPQCIEDPLVEGVTFLVKYLGKEPVDNNNEEEQTAAAIKDIITTAKKENSKLNRVSLTISEKGIKMVDILTQDIKLDISIYNVSYCTADATFDHVFAFICRDGATEALTCYAFLCPKRKMAKAATLTIAQGFSLAYQSWQEVRRPAMREKEEQSENVVVTTAVVEKQPFDADGGLIGASGDKVEDLLIDWTEENDTRSKPWDDNLREFEDSEPKASNWIQFDESDMNTQFERMTLKNGPMQIINQLPPNSSSLGFGAFACSPVLSDYGSSPGYGSSLTPSHLMSPVGSPFPNQLSVGSPGLPSPPVGSPLRGSYQSQGLLGQDIFRN